MSWRIGLVDSVWAGSGLEGRAGLREAKAIGFESVDLFVGYDPADQSERDRDEIRASLHETGLELWALVCATFGISDFNESVRGYSVERAKRIVDLASELGATTVMIAPGEYAFGGALFPREFEWGLVVDAAREIGRAAARHRLNVSVELLPFDSAFVNSVDALVTLLDDVALDNVTAAVDISHFWLRRISPDEIRRLDGRIGQVHIADCDGERHGDLPAGMGTTPFVEYLRVLDEAGYEGCASVELEFAPDGIDMADWVKRAFDGSIAVLESAELR
jgi:sugar phosphate isomerase/epimerase